MAEDQDGNGEHPGVVTADHEKRVGISTGEIRRHALPWLQALALLLLGFVVFIDSQNDEWNPPQMVWFILAFAIVGAGPRELVDTLKSVFGGGQ